MPSSTCLSSLFALLFVTTTTTATTFAASSRVTADMDASAPLKAFVHCHGSNRSVILRSSCSAVSPLTMKQKRSKRRIAERQTQASQLQHFDTGGGGGGTEAKEQEVPSNLRRKIRASRPALGHVIPKATRTKGAGGSSNPRLRPQGKAREAGMNNPSMLKIIGGSARGRRLDSPDVFLRPMMGKVREAVYSTFTSFGLYDEGKSTRHLDVFAGSGSVGLESLSRGASHCTFVDLAQDCCDAIRRNVRWCGFDDEHDGDNNVHVHVDAEKGRSKAEVICSDYLRVLRDPNSVGIPSGSTYQIVTLCPPYEEVMYADLLDAVANTDLITDDTVILIEYPIELGSLPHVVTRRDGGKLIGVRNRKYGRTVIAMYVANPTGRLEAAESRPEEFIFL